MEIYAKPNETKNGFNIPSDYNKGRLLEWFKKYKYFKIIPVEEDTDNRIGYLEGAVIPAYGKWQYGIDPRDQERRNAARNLFKQDFNGEIIEDRNGNPTKISKSTKGKRAELLNKYTEWATENGAPIPNPDLYKTWRDKWSTDIRFYEYQDWLDFLGIDIDSMPSAETIAKLHETKK